MDEAEGATPEVRGERALLVAVALVSAAGLAYEVALTRVLAIAQWHHFAYMIISVALLGFAVSGTALAILRDRIRGREASLFRWGALLLVLALPGCYALSQQLPFETFQLAARPRVQLGWLGLLYLVLSLPFFLVSWCVTLAFLLRRRGVGRVYFANLLGSGLGAAGVVGLLFVVPPARVPYLLAALPAAAFLVAVHHARSRRPAEGSGGSGRWWELRNPVALVPAAAAIALTGFAEIRVSEYKGLSYALDLPGAEVVAEEESPLSVLTAVRAPALRETPGQLSAYPMSRLGRLPDQIGLYFDAGAVSPVHRWRGSLSDFAWLDYVTGALPYRAVERPRTLVIGAGGGTEVLNALVHGAPEVTALEVDPGVFGLVRGPLAAWSGDLYGRDDVRPVVAEGRGWLRAHPEERFDVIQIALLDSFSAASAGVHALSESYLYTVQAVELYLERLSDHGVLAVTRWLRTPPRDAVKMFATLAEGAERAGIDDPGRHLAAVRSWNTATLLLSRRPLGGERVGAIRRFTEERRLDRVWLPGGVERTEANRFTMLEEPVYWEAARRILGPDREAFYEDYAFHVRPPTDDRPYFFRFFEWGSLPRLARAMGRGALDVVEWGYLALVGSAIQGVLAALLLVLLPLGAWHRWRRRARGGRGVEPEAGAGVSTPALVAYFTALGLAYLFLEIAFIQRFMLFLAYPVYAVAVVLASFLTFSGLGSAWAATRPERPPRLVGGAVVGIALFTAGYLLVLPPVFGWAAGWPGGAKACVAVALLAPLAFLMGIPFPSALQAVSDRAEGMVPWAWGVNGAASVVAAPLATLGAVHAGFTAVLAAAVALYGGAAVTVRRLTPPSAEVSLRQRTAPERETSEPTTTGGGGAR